MGHQAKVKVVVDQLPTSQSSVPTPRPTTIVATFIGPYLVPGTISCLAKTNRPPLRAEPHTYRQSQRSRLVNRRATENLENHFLGERWVIRFVALGSSRVAVLCQYSLHAHEVKSCRCEEEERLTGLSSAYYKGLLG